MLFTRVVRLRYMVDGLRRDFEALTRGCYVPQVQELDDRTEGTELNCSREWQRVS